MDIVLLAFASATDALGTERLALQLPESSTVQDLERHLLERYPALAPLWPRLAIAINGELVGRGAPIPDGAEIALLPPVSGGTSAPLADLVDDAIDVAGLLAALSDPSRGAVLLFLGNVRNHHEGRPVAGITYSAYRTMARQRLQRIVTELETASPGLHLGIVHRLGELTAGETSVAIAAASPHRAAAYEASRLALERLKAEVPIWKREQYADGETAWREEEPLEPSSREPRPEKAVF